MKSGYSVLSLSSRRGSSNKCSLLCLLLCSFTLFQLLAQLVKGQGEDGGCTVVLSNTTLNSSELYLTSEKCAHFKVVFSTEVDDFQTEFVLNEVVRFENVQNLSMVAATGARVKCGLNGPVAMSISGGQYLELQNLTFEDCAGRIAISNTASVNIHNCVFRNFSSGCVHIYNSTDVGVLGCVFDKCTTTFTQSTNEYMDFQALGSGLAVSFVSDVRGSLKVTDSTFSNCESRFKNSSSPNADSLFVGCGVDVDPLGNPSLVSAGSGAALSIGLVSSQVDVSISTSAFTRNSAEIYGGAIDVFMVSTSDQLEYRISFNKVNFSDNFACAGAGIVIGPYIDSYSPDNSIDLIFEDCSFENNHASVYGGSGLLSQRLNRMNVTFIRTEFIGNTATEAGSAILMSPLQFGLVNTTVVSLATFEDCWFERNDCPRLAAITTRQSIVTFKGRNHFHSNIGVAYGPVFTLTNVMGELIFEKTMGIGLDGGALYSTDQSQIRLFKGSQIKFLNNAGSIGASLILDRTPLPSPYSRLLFNPQCFFLFENDTVPPTKWHEHNVSMEFIGNSALYGSGTLLSHLDVCSWVSLSEPFFDKMGTIDSWPFVKADNNTNSLHENPTLGNWTTQTLAVEEEMQPLNNVTMYYPGQDITVNLSSRDEYGKPTVTSIMFNVVSVKGGAEGRVVTVPRVTTQGPDEPNITFAIAFTTASSGNAAPTEVTIALQRVFADPHIINNMWPNFTVTIGSCPVGHSLREMFGENKVFVCSCAPLREGDTSEFENCLDEGLLQFEFGFWGSTYPNQSSHFSTDVLQIHPCPFSYCRCFVAEVENNRLCISAFSALKPDAQCSCNRKGFLCGECTGEENGLTVIFNRCVPCQVGMAALIPLLFIIDVVAVILILELVRTVPGLFLPALYYVQTVPYLLRQVYIPELLHLLFYMNELLSLYFPWDVCLFPGATAAQVYALRYIPLGAAVVGVVIDLLGRRIYNKKKNYIGYDIGLWTLTLLLYNSLVHTSISVLNCPRLKDENGYEDSVWFIDGTVKCFREEHVPLALFAVCILAFCVLLIGFFLIAGLRPRLLEMRYLSVLEMYHSRAAEAYKEKLKWMPAFELARRFLLILLAHIVYSRGAILRFLPLAFIFLYTFLTPYKSIIMNIAEVLVLTFVQAAILYASNPFVLGPMETVSANSTLTGCESAFDAYSPEGLSYGIGVVTYLPCLLFPIGIGILVVAKCCHYFSTTNSQGRRRLPRVKRYFRKHQVSFHEPSLPHHFSEVMLRANSVVNPMLQDSVAVMEFKLNSVNPPPEDDHSSASTSL